MSSWFPTAPFNNSLWFSPGAPNSTLDAYESDAEATQQTTIAEAPTARKRPRLDRVQEVSYVIVELAIRILYLEP